MNVCILCAHRNIHKCMRNGKCQEFETNLQRRQRRDFIYLVSVFGMVLFFCMYKKFYAVFIAHGKHRKSFEIIDC